MNIVRPYLWRIGGAIAAVFLLSLALSGRSEVSEGKFWGSLLINVVAEGLGLCLGLWVAVYVARDVASERLDGMARPLLRLVAELRQSEKITGEAARQSVICAVHLLSEKSLESSRYSQSSEEASCDVCLLTVVTDSNGACVHCKLPGNCWKFGYDSDMAALRQDPIGDPQVPVGSVLKEGTEKRPTQALKRTPGGAA